MNNKRSYIGAAVGSGWRRAVFNLILLVAIALATVGSAVRIKSGVIDNLPKLFPQEQPKGAHYHDTGEKSGPSSIG